MRSTSRQIKRVYEEPDERDGCRILVDRLWPRGLTKVQAKVDVWLRDIAPSTDLRKWFSHDPVKWDEFQRRYLEELQRKPEQVELLLHELKKGPVTLLYGAKDELHNQAVILQQFLLRKGPGLL
jgi:uncharacterized protein YeaO (DUF488 family)